LYTCLLPFLDTTQWKLYRRISVFTLLTAHSTNVAFSVKTVFRAGPSGSIFSEKTMSALIVCCFLSAGQNYACRSWRGCVRSRPRLTTRRDHGFERIPKNQKGARCPRPFRLWDFKPYAKKYASWFASWPRTSKFASRSLSLFSYLGLGYSAKRLLKCFRLVRMFVHQFVARLGIRSFPGSRSLSTTTQRYG